MHFLKKRLFPLATALILTMGLSGMALAEENIAPIPNAPSTAIASKDISVQLDGKTLTFPDAAPMTLDGRTFLPLRSVFEALGAVVSYDAATNTVTANRGDTTVRMVLGAKETAVTTSGRTTTFAMDVAAFAQEGVTYVPVRFAAKAFGCAVGWDQDDTTVILVDTEKLLKEAVSQNQYTYMDKFWSYSERFQSGIWDMSANFDGAMTVFGANPIEITGNMEGTIAQGEKIAMTMDIKMDMKSFLKGLSPIFRQALSLTTGDQAMLEELKSEGISAGLRTDLSNGILYLTFIGGSDTLKTMNITAGTWYSLDINESYHKAMGVDFSTMMEASQVIDVSKLLSIGLSGLNLNNKDTSFSMVSALAADVAKALSDSSFVKTGNDYATTYVYERDGDRETVGLTLNMNGDAVVGYQLDMALSTDMEDENGNTITTDVITLSTAIDEKNQITSKGEVNVAPWLTMSLHLTGSYTAGEEVPVTGPPAGVTVLPFDRYIAIPVT